MMSPDTWQIVVLVLNAMWGLLLLLGGIFLKHFLGTLRRVEENLGKLNEAVLKNYATREDVETIRGYARERIHDFAADLQHMEICAALLAQKAGLELPPKARR